MKTTSMAILLALALAPGVALADGGLANGETYPDYYESAGRVVMKDVMTRFFRVNGKGILSYGMEDAAKTAGHVCPAITGAFLMTRAGVEALARSYRDKPSEGVAAYDPEDGVMYRGGIKVTMSGKGGEGGAPDAIANVMSLITGAKDATGFKNGPDFPFANRRNLLRHDPKLSFDPKTGIEAIFTSLKAEYKDKDGKPMSIEECRGTWHKCVETASCDRSVKVTYKFASPDIIGKDKDAPWDEKIRHIIEHRDLALKVEPVENPAEFCGE